MALLTGGAHTAELEVVVANIRSGKGIIRVAICSPDTFLKESCQWHGHGKAAAGEVKVVVEVPPGAWAAQAYQDETEIGRIPRNFFGLPTVGIGFSNDAPFRFGPPSFADAAFRLGAGGGRIRINLRYF